MRELSVSWRDVVLPLVVFALFMVLFLGFAQLTGWPNKKDGWSLVVGLGIAFAAAPLIARALSFLKASRATIEGPLGLKLNFASAVAGSEASSASITYSGVQQGVFIAESSRGELEQAADEAHRHRILVVDVEAGQAWYLTRLFALAATAEALGSPKLLVLVGQAAGKPRQAAGYISPAEFVRAVAAKDTRYARILRQAKAYAAALRTSGAGPADPGLPRLGNYRFVWAQVGEPVFMRILVEQLIAPDPNVLQPDEKPPEDPNAPPWVTLGDLALLLAPWLRTDLVDLDEPPKAQISSILSAMGDCVLAVRSGTFEGLIEVERAARHILRQLVDRAEA